MSALQEVESNFGKKISSFQNKILQIKKIITNDLRKTGINKKAKRDRNK